MTSQHVVSDRPGEEPPGQVRGPLRLSLPIPSAGSAGSRARAVLPEETRVSRTRLDGRAVFDTLGWDTVFAVPVSEVNQRFRDSWDYATTFEAKVSGTLFSTEIRGDFDAWEIMLGGSGALIFLRTPIRSGVMKVSGLEFDLAGAEVLIEVALGYLPQPEEEPEEGAGVPNALKVSAEPLGATDAPVSVVGLTIPGMTDDTVLSVAKTAFATFFNDNVSLITHVFALVNLDAIADDEAFQWLKATTTSYAYYDHPDSLEKAVFGVLCMVEGRPSDGNTNQFGPSAIPEGAQSGFSISSGRFMAKMVLPAMADAFNAGNDHKVDDSYFALGNADTEITNTKQIPLSDVAYLAIDYHPKCTSFKVTLDATRLKVETTTHVNISPGIDAYIETTSFYTVGLEEDAEGNQYLDYVEAEPTETRSWTDVADWIEDIETILTVITIVAAGCSKAIAKIVKSVAVAVIILVVLGVAAALPALIATVTADGVIGNVPTIDSLVLAATTDTKWTGGDAFEITLVRLNGALQLGGIAFPEPAGG